MKKLNIIFFAVVCILCFSHSASAQKRKFKDINKLVEETAENDDFKNAQFALLAVDVNTGEIIAEVNADKALKPASTQKLFSTSTILENYGPEFQFETVLAYTGVIDTINNILNGDIVIVGGGDPTLGSKYFKNDSVKNFIQKWIDDIKALGIDSIDGRIIADASLYSFDIVPETWSWEDMGNYYGAGPCGLTVFDNMYKIYFNSGNAGDTADIDRIEPKIENVFFENAIIADSISYDNAYIFGSPYTNYRYLRGEIPLNRNEFVVKGSIPDPPYHAALELEKALESAGIAVSKGATTIRNLTLFEHSTINGEKQIIDTYSSPLLSEIICETNVHSINLFAEHCLIHSGLRMGAPTNTSDCVSAMKEFWESKGMDIQGLSLLDGSGLSHYNAITPRQMVYLLTYMKKSSKYFDFFYNSLAIAGETGTIESMFKGTLAEGKLRAKSGTINRVKAYAGYTTSQSGREIVFSMVANNFSCSSSDARAKLEKLMISLTELNK